MINCTLTIIKKSQYRYIIESELALRTLHINKMYNE